ncbi:DUF2157 domain-containing protein [uncultured Capnocytophaga sp.]|uniref:DUF2157 domain-containing protein n=1 Tax=uncultured Capnocytophaga sp. TaxID=159273 RepID=UPI00262CF7FA|nr:DUF2157 domain-containing protein [uncultured Capnocytophaga sp.]
MKILKELDELTAAKVISPEVAERIRLYAQEQKQASSSHRLLTVFGALGAILIALGIIVILAHNWDELPRWTKTIISFLPLLAGQAGCGYILFKKGLQSWWGEAVAAFTSLSIGATIAMVHQVYNLPESSFANFLSLWLLLALPTLYLMRSRATTVLYYIGVGALCILGERKEWTTYYTSLVAFALILPFYIWHIKYMASSAITYAFHWFTVLFIGIALLIFHINIGEDDFGIWFVLLSAIYLMIGKYLQTSIYYNAYKVFALICIPFCLFTDHFFSWNNNEMIYIAIFLVLIYLLLVIKYYYIDKREKTLDLILVYPLVYIFSGFLWYYYLYDLAILLLGAYYIWKGFKSERSLLVNYGLAVISIEIAFRFFDSSFSFLVKGIVFILLGIGFFVTNYLIIKQKKNA